MSGLIFRGGRAGCWYTYLHMMSIVSSTGTLVKRLSASSEARISFPGCFVLSISRNSSVDLMLCLLGV